MGFFLREDFFMYNDDNDLCFRIKKLGYKVTYYPVDCIHLGGATAKKMAKTYKGGHSGREVSDRKPGDLLPQELPLGNGRLEPLAYGAVRFSDAD